MTSWIYCTGFGPFPGVSINPTQLLMTDLAHLSFGDVELRTRVLDVSFQRSQEQIDQDLAAEQVPPLAMIHFGVCRDTFLRLETHALNCMDSPTMDVDGVVFQSVPIWERYSIHHRFQTSVDVAPLLSMLRKDGIPVFSSQDAGRYVCNRVYAHSLYLQQQLHPNSISLFVHVPPLDCIYEGEGTIIWNRQTLGCVCAEIVSWIIQQSLQKKLT